jgi:organic radical activating enzyme
MSADPYGGSGQLIYLEETMADLMKKVKNLFFDKAKPLAAGFYHYHTPSEADFPYRLHLRVEADGEGILILNASTILHLNQTATEYAYHLIQQTPKSEVIETITTRYQTSYPAALQDFESFVDRIETLVSTPDLDPETYLDFARETPFSHASSAPFRLDCALTYNLHETSDTSIAPTDRVKKELSTEEWKLVIKKAWDAGIPHIIFTGGEPTLRADLIELAKYSDELGQVTGIISDGLRLCEESYLDELLNAGIDHLFITLDPDSQLAWQAVQKALDQDIYLVVHLTVNAQNSAQIADTIEKLKKMGLENISLSNPDIQLNELTQALRNQCAESGLDLVWNTPVPYSHFNPINIEIGKENELVEGAGIGWLYVEPDGDVLPAQGINTVLGNLLTDPWEAIWSQVKKS